MTEIVWTFVTSGAVIDAALALMVLEIVVAAAFHVRRPSRISLSLALNGFSGAFLLLALRAVWHGSNGALFAVFLTGALLAHLADLVVRLRR